MGVWRRPRGSKGGLQLGLNPRSGGSLSTGTLGQMGQMKETRGRGTWFRALPWTQKR
jgi:hypothetical protein